MTKLVVLSLVQGDLNNGFADVSVEIWNDGDSYPIKFHGSLPAAPEIRQAYQRWQFLYQALYQSKKSQTRLGKVNNFESDFESDFEFEEEDVVQFSEVEFSNLGQCLQNLINNWLNSLEFRTIDQKLRQYLHPEEEIRLVIQTLDKLLRRLPWHLWNFFEDYSHAEVALSPVDFQNPNHINLKKNNQKIRILAIIGNSQGIDTHKDREFLTELSDRAEIDFLVEPQREELNNRLWEKGWDILFFAGHSSTEDKGIIKINQTDAISLDKLRNALKKAIAGGLRLAIFNSCDGLGLAEDLEDLNIPQVIVMREPVPDMVAQKFLRYFLQEFAHGQSLYTAVRSARERLQGLEDKYPCATWLPVLSQNPATVPMVWYSPEQSNIFPKWKHIAAFLAIATAISGSVLGIRHLGFLQSSELQAFDGMMQLQPLKERPDPRLLVVTIDEADIQYQFAKEMTMEFSL
ncbi:MAG: CHAT domain-containing protein, partial [Cyanobacteria bacterium P01_A01_bin.45]